MLSATIGVSVRLLSELERGVRPNVSLETTLQLLRALGMALRVSDWPNTGDGELDREARRASRVTTWVGSIASLNSVP